MEKGVAYRPVSSLLSHSLAALGSSSSFLISWSNRSCLSPSRRQSVGSRSFHSRLASILPPERSPSGEEEWEGSKGTAREP